VKRDEPQVWCGMQQARECEAEEAAEGARNPEGGTRSDRWHRSTEGRGNAAGSGRFVWYRRRGARSMGRKRPHIFNAREEL
jgi:hypothetical protein